MSNRARTGLVLLAAILLAGCGATEIEMSCQPAGDVVPLCGVQMPEDLAVLPEEGGLLISEFGNMGQLPGALSWLQPGADTPLVRLADSANIAPGAGAENWGEVDCPLPDQLSPHGIHLSQRDESWQLLVVNHSTLEQVLMYQVLPATIPGQAPALAWRGCVTFPGFAVLNDVAALPDGGFAVTHMYERKNEMLAQIQSALGLNNGHVWRWSPGSGRRVIAGSEAKMPNGIEVAADGKSIWVNNYFEQELRQYDLASQRITARIHVPNIDNSAWLDEGRLLVASHTSPLGMGRCFGLTQGSCGAGYELVEVDVRSATSRVIFRSQEGGPFGPATVAVPYRGKLYAGSFSGDRLAEITVDER